MAMRCERCGGPIYQPEDGCIPCRIEIGEASRMRSQVDEFERRSREIAEWAEGEQARLRRSRTNAAAASTCAALLLGILSITSALAGRHEFGALVGIAAVVLGLLSGRMWREIARGP